MSWLPKEAQSLFRTCPPWVGWRSVPRPAYSLPHPHDVFPTMNSSRRPQETASVHVREAVAGGTGFLWEINGPTERSGSPVDAACPRSIP